MDQINANFLNMLNDILGNLRGVIISGILFMILCEFKKFIVIFKKAKKGDRKERLLTFFHAIKKDLLYIIGGIALVMTSYGIVNLIMTGLLPADFKSIDYQNFEVQNIWTALKYHSRFSGKIAVTMIIFAGFFLTISGGRSRWLINFSKLLVLLSVVYITIFSFIMYL